MAAAHGWQWTAVADGRIRQRATSDDGGGQRERRLHRKQAEGCGWLLAGEGSARQVAADDGSSAL